MLSFLEIVLIGLILVILAVAVWAAIRLARRKGREPWTWALLTLVFLPALLVLALLPSRRARLTSAAS